MTVDVQHEIRRLIAHLVTTEALPLLQTTMDAARAAMGLVIHRDHPDNREFYLARLDFVLDSAPWPIAPVVSHTIAEVTPAGVVRRVDACKWCDNPAEPGETVCAPCARSNAAHSHAGGPAWARCGPFAASPVGSAPSERLPGDAS